MGHFLVSMLLALPAAGAAGEDRAGAPPPSADEILAYLGFDAEAKRDLMAGKIISKDFHESTEKELAVAVAMEVALPLSEVFKRARAGMTLEADRDVLAFKDLGEEPPEEDVSGIGFTPAESGEVRNLLDAAPGSTLNLSAREIEAFRALSRRIPGRGQERKLECAEAVGGEYRRLLFERLRSYRENGLAAIAPYDRGGGREARPGEELKKAAEAARFLKDRFPGFYRAFLEYPEAQTEGIEHRFSWVKQRVEGRPAIVLAHRMFYLLKDGALIVERQLYVGHSYNSLQIVIGCLPAGAKTMCFYTNRTSTDQVAGFASGLRHSLGRKRMLEKIVANFEVIRTRAAVKASR